MSLRSRRTQEAPNRHQAIARKGQMGSQESDEKDQGVAQRIPRQANKVAQERPREAKGVA